VTSAVVVYVSMLACSDVTGAACGVALDGDARSCSSKGVQEARYAGGYVDGMGISKGGGAYRWIHCIDG
jgi:hypothetical protein